MWSVTLAVHRPVGYAAGKKRKTSNVNMWNKSVSQFWWNIHARKGRLGIGSNIKAMGKSMPRPHSSRARGLKVKWKDNETSSLGQIERSSQRFGGQTYFTPKVDDVKEQEGNGPSELRAIGQWKQYLRSLLTMGLSFSAVLAGFWCVNPKVSM